MLTLRNLPPASKPLNFCSPASRHETTIRSKQVSNLLKQMPGAFYQTLSELLGEKLPLIIFTNRQSFKVSLDAMISCYANCQAQINEHKELVQRELQASKQHEDGSSPTARSRAQAADRYLIVPIPEEEADNQPSNSQHGSAITEVEAPSSTPRRRQLPSERSTSAQDASDEHLEAELLEITQV